MLGKITSDDFPRDPYGWLTNQCGHGVLGLSIAVVAMWLGLWWAWCPMVAALLYWVIVEVWGQHLLLWRDAIMDTANVMAGATLPAAILMQDATAVVALVVWAVLLAFGYWRRM